MNRPWVYRWITGAAAGIVVLAAAGCGKTAGEAGVQETVKPGSETVLNEGEGNVGTDGSMGASGSAEETLITGNGNDVTIQGQGAAKEGNVITISSPGIYRLSGTVEDGRIVVDAGKEDEVRLILDGFTITSSDFSAIYADQSGLLTVVLEKGTDNRVADGAAYQYETAGADKSVTADEPDAAIFSRDDMVMEGEGSLTVHGNYQDGIRGKDDVTIKSGTYVIEAVNDGIKGRDSVEVEGGTVTITAGGDGIQSNNDEDEDKGYVKVTGGTLSITAGKKGILAETLVEIEDGVILADAQDDAVHSDGDVMIRGGKLTLSSGDDAVHGGNHVEISGGDIKVIKSYEGLEGLSIDITGGTIDIVSEDDGINAAGGTDGSGTDGRKTKGGMKGSGRENAGAGRENTGAVRENAGSGRENAGSGRENAGSGRPDAVGRTEGAPGGSGSADKNEIIPDISDIQEGRRMQGGSPFGATEGAYIRITGGTVKVNASGDGIDSNGDFFMEGGELRVEGPTEGGNGALDYDGTGTILGGNVLVTGSAGMFQGFSEDSSQPVLILYYTERQSAGTQVTVKDSQGNILAETTPSKDFEALLFSCPQLENGETYAIVTEDETVDIAVEGVINQSGAPEGGGRPGTDSGRGGSGGRGARGPALPDGENGLETTLD